MRSYLRRPNSIYGIPAGLHMPNFITGRRCLWEFLAAQSRWPSCLVSSLYASRFPHCSCDRRKLLRRNGLRSDVPRYRLDRSRVCGRNTPSAWACPSTACFLSRLQCCGLRHLPSRLLPMTWSSDGREEGHPSLPRQSFEHTLLWEIRPETQKAKALIHGCYKPPINLARHHATRCALHC